MSYCSTSIDYTKFLKFYITRFEGSMAVIKVLFCVYIFFIWVASYFIIWLFTGLTNGRCKRSTTSTLSRKRNYMPYRTKRMKFVRGEHFGSMKKKLRNVIV